jgi:hypothetical protein
VAQQRTVRFVDDLDGSKAVRSRLVEFPTPVRVLTDAVVVECENDGDSVSIHAS